MESVSHSHDILDLDRRVLEARLHQDLATYQSLVDPSFLGIDAGGVLTTAAQRFAEFNQIIYEVLETGEHRVRVYGPTAVVTGKMKAQGCSYGQMFQGDYHYTHVYVQLEHGWRLVSAQTTSIS
jgi:ketosteroid isomerase-like protein